MKEKSRLIDFRNLQINFKNPKQIFPNRFTKIRMPTDMINKINKESKNMNQRDLTNVIDKVQRWNQRDFEFIARRNKKGIKLIPFDVED
jgi:hypothetical protein